MQMVPRSSTKVLAWTPLLLLTTPSSSSSPFLTFPTRSTDHQSFSAISRTAPPPPRHQPLHPTAIKTTRTTTITKTMSPASVFIGFISSLLLLLSCSSSNSSAAASDHYIRPPPGRVITTSFTKSESHPQQVHISAVGSDHMRISWITEDKKSPALVEYGKVSGKYDSSSVEGETTSYRYFFYNSGKIHHVIIGPIEPNTVYYYRLGGGGNEFSFRSPPATLPVEFVIIGDLGQTEWTASTLSHVNASDYDMLLLPGDLSYADTQQPLWDTFGRFVEPYASNRPWMVTEGNHEIESILPVFTKPFESYNARWRMPYEQSGSNSNLYYSFDAAGGAVHVLMLGSYTDFGPDSDQYNWLKKDLAKVDRSKTPWLIALLHAPWYNTNAAHQGEGESMRKDVEKLLYDARVDAVFAGHVHAYERFTRIYNNKADPCGPVYITIGDGGNREGLALDFLKNHKSRPLSLYREASFGHGRLRIIDAKQARWSWQRNDDSNAVAEDEVLIESLSSSSKCGFAENFPKSSSTVNDEF